MFRASRHQYDSPTAFSPGAQSLGRGHGARGRRARWCASWWSAKKQGGAGGFIALLEPFPGHSTYIYIYRSKLEWLISGVSLARQSLFQSHGLFGIDELIEASWIPTGSDPNSGTTELERSLAAVPAPLVSHDWH